MNNFIDFLIVKAVIEYKDGFRGKATWKFDKTWQSISVDDCVHLVAQLINSGDKRKVIGSIQILIDYEKYVEKEKKDMLKKAIEIAIK